MDLVTKIRKRKNHNLSFIKRISPIIEYFKKNGTISNIKQNEVFEVDGEVIKIGWLITNLRQEKRKGILQDYDIILLDYLGIDWGDILSQHFEVVEYYYAKHGTLSTLTQYSGDYKYKDKVVNLGYIVTYLRQSKDLTKEQIESLEQKGLNLAPKNIDNVLAPIKEYYQRKGTIADIVHSDTIIIDGVKYNIGRKINYFRTKYNKGQLKEEYVDALNAMGMKWATKKQEENLIEM